MGAGGGSAPISAPDAQPLGRKRSCKLSPALLYSVQGRGRANHRNAQAPFKPDISPTGTNCPNNQHPNLLRASGAAGRWISLQACAARTDCAGLHREKKAESQRINDSYRCGYRRTGRRSELGHHVDIAVLRVYAGASGVRLRGVAAGRQPGEARPLPVVSTRLRSPPQKRERPQSKGGGGFSPGELQRAL